MRIISGKWRSRQLKFPKSKQVRPTQDRVREAIFSKLGIVDDCKVLDVCCGSGALGLEALSRGSSFVCFVDTDTKIVKENIKLLECGQDVTVVTKRAQSFLKNCDDLYDIIFLDPPWRELEVYHDSLKAIYDNDILNENGLILVEYSKKYPPFSSTDLKVSTYGETAISMMTNDILDKWLKEGIKKDEK